MTKLIQEKWVEFDLLVLDGLPEFQKREMKRAFYSGVHCLRIIHSDIDDMKISSGEKEKLVSGIADELKDFKDEIAKGNA